VPGLDGLRPHHHHQRTANRWVGDAAQIQRAVTPATIRLILKPLSKGLTTDTNRHLHEHVIEAGMVGVIELPDGEAS